MGNLSELEIAKRIVLAYLGQNYCDAETISEMLYIKHGDKQALIDHFTAMKNIFTKALEELERNEDNE